MYECARFEAKYIGLNLCDRDRVKQNNNRAVNNNRSFVADDLQTIVSTAFP